MTECLITDPKIEKWKKIFSLFCDRSERYIAYDDNNKTALQYLTVFRISNIHFKGKGKKK